MLQDINRDSESANSHRLKMLAPQERVAFELRAEIRMIGGGVNRAVVIQAAAGTLQNQNLDIGRGQRGADVLLDRLTRELGPFGENHRAPIFREIGGNFAQQAQRQLVAARTAILKRRGRETRRRGHEGRLRNDDVESFARDRREHIALAKLDVVDAVECRVDLSTARSRAR